jgi:hypothetical protein
MAFTLSGAGVQRRSLSVGSESSVRERELSRGTITSCVEMTNAQSFFILSACYRIIAEMPDQDGDHVYRIKSPLEEYERVVKESLLVRSQGCLPEDRADEKSREASITLPTLLRVEKRGSSRLRSAH